MTSALIEFLLNRRNNKADVTICERDSFDSPQFFEASDRQFNGDMDALHNCNARARSFISLTLTCDDDSVVCLLRPRP